MFFGAHMSPEFLMIVGAGVGIVGRIGRVRVVV